MERANTIKIGNRLIGRGHPVFIIAEAGVNHNGSLDRAISMVDEAVACGTDCVKFQTFETENIETRHSLKPSYFKGRASEFDKISYLKSVELSREGFRKLKDHCRSKNILFLSTVSDEAGLEVLLSIGVPALKVGSTDTVNLPLLRLCGRSGLPVILSTGISTLSDVDTSVKELVMSGASEIVLMQCTSAYPSSVEELNLRVIETFMKRFNVPVGLSDHSLGNYAAIAAVALGASVIEKHFTLDKTLPGVDHAASASPEEFRELVKVIRLTEKALGSYEKAVEPQEAEHLLTMRKSLVARKDLPEGTVFSYTDILCKRPGTGISPIDIDKVISKRLKVALGKDDIITWDMLE